MKNLNLRLINNTIDRERFMALLQIGNSNLKSMFGGGVGDIKIEGGLRDAVSLLEELELYFGSGTDAINYFKSPNSLLNGESILSMLSKNKAEEMYNIIRAKLEERRTERKGKKKGRKVS